MQYVMFTEEPPKPSGPSPSPSPGPLPGPSPTPVKPVVITPDPIPHVCPPGPDCPVCAANGGILKKHLMCIGIGMALGAIIVYLLRKMKRGSM